MHFRCPNQDCQSEFEISGAHVGDEVTCPDCGTRFVTGEFDLGDLSELPAQDGAPAGEDLDAPATIEQKMEEAPPDSDPMIGMKLGGCRINSKLGQGGMGAVYKGHHEGLDIDVAMKVLPRHLAEQNPDFIDRFKREARVAARLSHGNVVNVMNVGEEEGQNFIIMEFVEGEDLKEYLDREGKLELHLALDIIQQIFEALDAGHSVGILHRDIKPANIFLTKGRGGKLVAKLGDFGLAKVDTSGDSSSGNTMSGMMMGTPHYISPEQAEDAKRVDARADIYSMGCMLYYMLCGRVPYDGEGFVQIVLQHMQGTIPDPRELRTDVPAELAATVMKMMAKRADDRFQTSAEILEVLEKIERGLRTGDMTSVGIEMPVARAAPAAAPEAAPTGGTITCPHDDCGKETSADAQWCEFCGRSLFEECRSCRKEVRALRPFCPYCRYDLDKSRKIYEHLEACKKHTEEKRPASILEEALAVLELESGDEDGAQFKQQAEAALQEAAELREQAEEAFTLKDYDSIAEFLKNALEITPHDEELQAQLENLPERIRQRELHDKLEEARDAQNNRLPRQSLAAFEQALELASDSEDALGGKQACEEILSQVAQIKEEVGAIPEEDLQAQLEAWTKVLELDVADEEGRQQHAALDGRINQTREYVHAALESRRLRDWEASFDAWQEALSIWPICPEAAAGVKISERLQEACRLLEEKHLPEALEQAKAALEIDPECPDSLQLRNEIQSSLDQVEELKAKADEATSPDDYDAGLAMVEEALEIHPHDESLHERAADLKERIRIRDFERSLAEGKAAWDSYLPRQARQAFQQAVELEPSSDEAQEGLEKCQNVIRQVEELTATAQQHEQNGELDQAIVVWDQILELDPESQEAPGIRKKLGDQLSSAKEFIGKAMEEVETRDWGKALHQWDEALRLWSACPEAQNGKAQAAEQLEQFQQLFTQAKQLFGERRTTSALEIHHQTLGIGISEEALALQDQMAATHHQAEVLAQAGRGAAGQSLWREAAEKLQSAGDLDRESINKEELKKAQDLASKVQAHLGKSEALLKDGYFQDAETEAQKGLEYGPDLKLQEVASQSGKRSQRVQEAVDEAEQCEDQDPSQAVSLWEEVLSLQPVHAEAPKRIAKLRKRIDDAQRKFDEAKNWEGRKKWSKMLLAAQAVQALNPTFPHIGTVIQKARVKYRNQKIIFAATAAAILLAVACFIYDQANAKTYRSALVEGRAGLGAGKWSDAQTAFAMAEGAFLFRGTPPEASALQRLAVRIEEADQKLEEAKKLASASEDDWKKVIAAYELARDKLKDLDLGPLSAELKEWLRRWETQEYQACDKHCSALTDPRDRARVLQNFLKAHPGASNTKSIESRIRSFLQGHFDISYQGLADRFEQDFLIKEKEGDCRRILEQLRKLEEEAQKANIKISVPTHRTLAVLTKNLTEADQVRAIKQAVQSAKAEFKKAQTAQDKIAAWTKFQNRYPGKETNTILGELEDEYNGLARTFEGLLAKDSAVFGKTDATEGQTTYRAASDLFEEARKASLNFQIAKPENQPPSLARRLTEKIVAVEDQAFAAATANAATKTPQEKITIWDEFLAGFPKETFGKHHQAASDNSQKAHVEDYTARYGQHIQDFKTANQTQDFKKADAELKKAEQLAQDARTGGYPFTPDPNPAALRDDLDYAMASANAEAAATPREVITAWNPFLAGHPASEKIADVRGKVEVAYKTAYGDLLTSFKDNLAKTATEGFAAAAKDIQAAETLLQEGVQAKYNQQNISGARTIESLREELAFSQAKFTAGEQIKGQKFDEALKTWEDFAARKYPPGSYTAKAQEELKVTRQAAADWFVGEGQKALDANQLSAAYKQVQVALSYLAEARNAIDLQKQIVPKFIVASGVFEIPTGDKDRFGGPILKGEDDRTGYPKEIQHKTTQMHFIFVSAGDFMMGDPKNADKDSPQHPITISKPFYLGKYEVTLGEIKLFDKENGNVLTNDVSKRQKESDEAMKMVGQDPITISSWMSPGFNHDDSHPAVHMTVAHAEQFLGWLNKGYGKARKLFLLPTEAQWEYACRAGSTTEFFWGNDEDAATQHANFKNNSTTPVGSKKPNAFGIYDLIGNAMEWCQDWYDESFYTASPKEDPVCQKQATSRVCRGGSFADRGLRLRSAYRNKNKATYDSNTMGFRLSIDAGATMEKSTIFAAGSQ